MRRLRQRFARDGADGRERTLAGRDGGVLPGPRGAPPRRGPAPARRDLPSRLTVAAAPEPLLRLEHAAKSFGAVRALEDVHIDLYAGEAHGLVGENGAGKSTMVKILAGVHNPDGGTLTLDGQPLVFTGPADALAAGIAVIYQEPTLFPDLSVAENIFIGRQPLRGLRRIDPDAMRAACRQLFGRL